MTNDMRYAPKTVSIVKGKDHYHNVPVTGWTLHPPGSTKMHTAIRKDLHVLECITPIGSRFYGVEGGRINSELRMVVWGGFINARNELVKSWERAES